MRAYLCQLNGVAGVIFTDRERRNKGRLKEEFIRSTYAQKRFDPTEMTRLVKKCEVREVDINDRGFVAFKVGVKETSIIPF
jgi:hypothetical protein